MDPLWFFFSCRGRIGRRAFWLHQLAFVMIGIPLFFPVFLLTHPDKTRGWMWVVFIFWPALWSLLAVQVKRWHDRNKSGWWPLIISVPVIGQLWAFAELTLLRGTSGENRFGPDPLAETQAQDKMDGSSMPGLLRRWGLALGIMLFLPIVVHTSATVWLSFKIRGKLNELKREGRPVEVQDIRRSPVPDEENAAPIYEKVFALVDWDGSHPSKYRGKGPFTGMFKHVIMVDRLGEWSSSARSGTPQYDDVFLSGPCDVPITYQMVEWTQAPSLSQLLEEARGKPHCDFQIDYENGPHMRVAHWMAGTIVRGLAYKAILDSAAGRLQEAVDSVLAGLKMIDHLREEPEPISQLLQVRMVKRMAWAGEHIASYEHLSRQQLQALTAAYSEWGEMGAFPSRKSLDVERVVFGSWVFRKAFRKAGPSWEMIRHVCVTHHPERVLWWAVYPSYLCRPLHELDMLAYLDVIEELGRLFELPYREFPASLGELRQRIRALPTHCFVTRNLLGTLGAKDSRQGVAFTRARIELVRTAFALRLHRQEHGDYPDSLADLVPDILPSIPRDPFSDESLLYRKLGESFVLYSVGFDLTDDGAKPVTLPTRWTRREWQRYKGDFVWQHRKVNSIGMKFRLVQPGSFTLLPPQDSGDAEGGRKVTITKPFYLGVHEVTRGQWQEVMGTTPSAYRVPRDWFQEALGTPPPKSNRLAWPVESVSWHDAQEFVRRLSEREGIRYRLPTEAEWEYACRAGVTIEAGPSDEIDPPLKPGICTAAEQWLRKRRGKRYDAGRKAAVAEGTQEVGKQGANGWGFCDMAGNVWEWCAEPCCEYADGSAAPPTARPEAKRVLRHGWRSVTKGSWSDVRRLAALAHRAPDLGFRVCREPVAPASPQIPALLPK